MTTASSAGRPDFSFKLPMLPRVVYTALRDLKERHSISQWYAVIAGIVLLVELEQENPARLKEVLDRVKASY